MNKETMTTENTVRDDGGSTRHRAPRWRRRLFDQRWVVDNLPYLLFLCLLAVVYIYNGHHAEKRVKDINRTAEELRELQYEYKAVKSELMFREKQSEVRRSVAATGLREAAVPPFRLTDTLP